MCIMCCIMTKCFPLLGHKMARCVQLTSSFFMGYSENAGFFYKSLVLCYGSVWPIYILLL